jgi:hypothetical protein
MLFLLSALAIPRLSNTLFSLHNLLHPLKEKSDGFGERGGQGIDSRQPIRLFGNWSFNECRKILTEMRDAPSC